MGVQHDVRFVCDACGFTHKAATSREKFEEAGFFQANLSISRVEDPARDAHLFHFFLCRACNETFNPRVILALEALVQ
jgi:hypothetical protein